MDRSTCYVSRVTELRSPESGKSWIQPYKHPSVSKRDLEVGKPSGAHVPGHRACAAAQKPCPTQGKMARAGI